MMRAFLSNPQRNMPLSMSISPATVRNMSDMSMIQAPGPQLANDIFTGYLSDLSDDQLELEEDENNIVDDSPGQPSASSSSNALFSTRAPPPLKRRKLDVPVRVDRQNAKKARETEFKKALTDIEKLIASKRDVFATGRNGLQAYRGRAVQSCLHMIVNNKRGLIDASQRAAESQGFAEKWGGRLVRSWVRIWIKERKLPVSSRGRHMKVFTLLSDPGVCAELRSYVRSNKWAMNPEKLAAFSKNQMVPAVAEKYVRQITVFEIPQGLSKYLELELFPRIQLKVGKGVSLRTARRWLHREGFKYTEHKKSLYFDGHERPDVVEYRQDVFLPEMAEHRKRLVEYVVGDVEKELLTTPANWVERRLVLVAHDEMTAQANNADAKSWVLDGEHALKKKGVGRGMHQSDVICSTVGWLKEASQSLEYGKNYDGYWNGELFIKQVRFQFDFLMLRNPEFIYMHVSKQLVEKIIPAFERAHGPGYQALIMVDNSQGHSAYSVDALLTSRMNLRPGGKQARLRNTWYFRHGQHIEQEMNFPHNHPEFPNMPKGMRQVLIERGLWSEGLRMSCKSCKCGETRCCAKRILDLQPDFQAQKSLVQEVIEAAGHLCIFLPKFHCELNFIEFFWGAVKKYLRQNCDYTFSTLQANLPEALASVHLDTIRRWEHRMVRWMDAYRSGLGAKDAQTKVKQFSSRQYTSHRRVPETVARQFDE
jgi:hypothetical protein